MLIFDLNKERTLTVSKKHLLLARSRIQNIRNYYAQIIYVK